jgi:hypothetical protein
VFYVHDTEREAESTVERLRGFGIHVAKEQTRAGVLAPGMTIAEAPAR